MSAVFKTYTITVTPASTTSLPQLLARNYANGDYYVQVAAVVTGTVNFTVQYTYDVVDATSWSASTANWLALSDVTAATANADTRITSPITAVRVVLNSGSGSVVTVLTQVHPDIGNN